MPDPKYSKPARLNIMSEARARKELKSLLKTFRSLETSTRSKPMAEAMSVMEKAVTSLLQAQ